MGSGIGKISSKLRADGSGSKAQAPAKQAAPDPAAPQEPRPSVSALSVSEPKWTGGNMEHVTERKIVRGLKAKKLTMEAQAKGHAPATFTRIVLRFGLIHKVLSHVRETFNSVAVERNGARGVSKDDLKHAFQELHVPLTDQATGELFDLSDVSHHHVLDLKEFMVCLVVAKVMDIIPNLHSPTPGAMKPAAVGAAAAAAVEAAAAAKEAEAEAAGASAAGAAGVEAEAHCKQSSHRVEDTMSAYVEEVRMVLDLIVQAYLIFDKDAKGYIERETLDAILEGADDKEGGHGHSFLSDESWGKMDWDHSGRLSFEEFVYTFSHWVDIEDDDGDDDCGDSPQQA